MRERKEGEGYLSVELRAFGHRTGVKLRQSALRSGITDHLRLTVSTRVCVPISSQYFRGHTSAICGTEMLPLVGRNLRTITILTNPSVRWRSEWMLPVAWVSELEVEYVLRL